MVFYGGVKDVLCVYGAVWQEHVAGDRGTEKGAVVAK